MHPIKQYEYIGMGLYDYDEYEELQKSYMPRNILIKLFIKNLKDDNFK